VYAYCTLFVEYYKLKYRYATVFYYLNSRNNGSHDLTVTAPCYSVNVIV